MPTSWSMVKRPKKGLGLNGKHTWGQLTQPFGVHFRVGVRVDKSYLSSISSEAIADESDIKSQESS